MALPITKCIRRAKELRRTHFIGKLIKKELRAGHGDIKFVETIGAGYPDPKIFEKARKQFQDFIETRYIIATQYYLGGGGSISPVPTLNYVIDNYGQRHEVYLATELTPTGAVKDAYFYPGSLKLDKIKYPVPLPDILIDQIKLIAQLGTNTNYDQYQTWNPISHIKNLSE